MRLWSLHPSLLDPKGIVALWREALLAQKVLLGKTKGYRNHPQLNRFKICQKPTAAIATYLWAVQKEATRRGYKFDAAKIKHKSVNGKLPVTKGQVLYELKHLKRKLKIRNPLSYARLRTLKKIKAHPLFKIIPGSIEKWERTA